ncbi:MAG TPA: hypothetical protein QKA14_02115 [Candidatus Megaira endosymbiont of Hartmannula sinica]|nr:hypothetical protein [Candidatus Megaera endosymbiont of Hartmannula sinica]
MNNSVKFYIGFLSLIFIAAVSEVVISSNIEFLIFSPNNIIIVFYYFYSLYNIPYIIIFFLGMFIDTIGSNISSVK